MTPLIITGIGMGISFVTLAIALGTILYKIGRWQSKAEGRAFVLGERLDSVHHEIAGTNSRLDRMNGSIRDVNRRVDVYLEGHIAS